MNVAYSVNGSTARLAPATGASLACGPGQRGPDAGGSILFAAGAGISDIDLFAAFWRDELPGMDWFTDFLCDAEMDGFLFRLANPPPEDDEPEAMYSKSQLVTLGSEVMEQY